MSIIKDGRIVCDKTFATRFVSFLKGVQIGDSVSEEELDYMRKIANSLLLHQANTASKDEREYLHRLHPDGV